VNVPQHLQDRVKSAMEEGPQRDLRSSEGAGWASQRVCAVAGL
jgi:hypothetical protein